MTFLGYVSGRSRQLFVFKDQGLSTAWDDHLSYLLTPALSAYETERITGGFTSKLILCMVINSHKTRVLLRADTRVSKALAAIIELRTGVQTKLVCWERGSNQLGHPPPPRKPTQVGWPRKTNERIVNKKFQLFVSFQISLRCLWWPRARWPLMSLCYSENTFHMEGGGSSQ